MRKLVPQTTTIKLIGHSQKTAKKHYLLADNHRAANVARKAQRKLGIEFSDSESDNDDTVLAPTNYQPKPWGTAHPCYLVPPHKKAYFSKEEKSYLWAKVYECPQYNNSPGKKKLSHNFVSGTWKFIIKDDLAVPIFHERHILKADRLRSCLKSFDVGIR